MNTPNKNQSTTKIIKRYDRVKSRFQTKSQQSKNIKNHFFASLKIIKHIII